MSISELKHVSEGPRRFDVFTGAGRRRTFMAAEKAAIVAESYSGEDSVCGVARRHGLTPQQLFAWRRLSRSEPFPPAEQALFVPVVVKPEPEASAASETAKGLKPRHRRRRTERASIELEMSGVVVRVGRDADASVIAAVIGALKAGA